MSPKTQEYLTMKLSTNPNRISADIQEHSDPPLIPLKREVSENLKEFDIINIKICRDPASTTSKTYELKIATSKNSKTRRIPCAYEELQDHNLRDRNYFRIQKNQLYTYSVTSIISNKIRRVGKSSPGNDKHPSEFHQVGFTGYFSNQCTYQSEACNAP